jgi:hypothetical protein
MTAFAHVTDEKTRAILQSPDPSRRELEYALNHATACQSADLDDEDVSFALWNNRAVALDQSRRAWREGQFMACRDLLGRFWNT